MVKALIVIDMINADVSKRRDKKKLICNQKLLISAFKKKKFKVILTGGTLKCEHNYLKVEYSLQHDHQWLYV